MKHALTLLAGLSLILAPACGDAHDDADHGHDHGPGADHSHDEGVEAPREEAHDEGDEHAEEPLGTVRIGELDVALAQGHGGVAAGKESHLVVKLPYSDQGATIVRAWIGTADRTLSLVGKAEYAADHDDYDVHATAPDPLPADARWWIELEQPDGSKVVGSADVKRE